MKFSKTQWFVEIWLTILVLKVLPFVFLDLHNIPSKKEKKKFNLFLQ